MVSIDVNLWGVRCAEHHTENVVHRDKNTPIMPFVNVAFIFYGSHWDCVSYLVPETANTLHSLLVMVSHSICLWAWSYSYNIHITARTWLEDLAVISI